MSEKPVSRIKPGSAGRKLKKAPMAFRTIGEASQELSLQPHILRFWETKFGALQPLKQNAGRRLYRPEDMNVLRNLRQLLHEEGYTIRAVQKLVEEQGAAILLGVGPNKGRSALTNLNPREIQAAVAAAAQAGAFGGDGGMRQLGEDEKLRLNRALDTLTALRARLDAYRQSGIAKAS